MRFAKKVGNNKAFENVAGAVIKEVPGTIGNLSKRVKYKKLKLILDSDITGLDLAMDTRWINLIINVYFVFFVFN